MEIHQCFYRGFHPKHTQIKQGDVSLLFVMSDLMFQNSVHVDPCSLIIKVVNKDQHTSQLLSTWVTSQQGVKVLDYALTPDCLIWL